MSPPVITAADANDWRWRVAVDVEASDLDALDSAVVDAATIALALFWNIAASLDFAPHPSGRGMVD
jgi:hypothetical protein